MRPLILSSALALHAFRSRGLTAGHAQTLEELLRGIQREGGAHPPSMKSGSPEWTDV